jgi:hypothetical protein
MPHTLDHGYAMVSDGLHPWGSVSEVVVGWVERADNLMGGGCDRSRRRGLVGDTEGGEKRSRCGRRMGKSLSDDLIADDGVSSQ